MDQPRVVVRRRDAVAPGWFGLAATVPRFNAAARRADRLPMASLVVTNGGTLPLNTAA